MSVEKNGNTFKYILYSVSQTKESDSSHFYPVHLHRYASERDKRVPPSHYQMSPLGRRFLCVNESQKMLEFDPRRPGNESSHCSCLVSFGPLGCYFFLQGEFSKLYYCSSYDR